MLWETPYVLTFFTTVLSGVATRLLSLALI